jgi:hypothetical protein
MPKTESGYYDPDARSILPVFFKFDWENILWKIIIVEAIYFIAKILYGAYVVQELLKRHPEMVIPEYFTLLPWQTFASPIWLIYRAVLPAATGEDLEKNRQQAIEDLGIPSFVDDIFGKYTYLVMIGLPCLILFLEWNGYRKKKKFAERYNHVRR